MRRRLLVRKTALSIIAVLSVTSIAIAQSKENRQSFTKAIVVDDRLSALRRDPNVKSPVLRRLHTGRPVRIIESKKSGPDQSRFYRVAVTRRTRGWIHEAAIAVPGRRDDDDRLMKLIETATDSTERIALCKLFLEYFTRSALAPRAWLAMGEEADRAATTLTRNARRRLKTLGEGTTNASLRDYYLNDSGLDRYSRLHVVFNFKDSTVEYSYDGKAYREIVRRFPNSREAQVARARLSSADERLAHQR